MNLKFQAWHRRGSHLVEEFSLFQGGNNRLNGEQTTDVCYVLEQVREVYFLTNQVKFSHSADTAHRPRQQSRARDIDYPHLFHQESLFPSQKLVLTSEVCGLKHQIPTQNVESSTSQLTVRC